MDGPAEKSLAAAGGTRLFVRDLPVPAARRRGGVVLMHGLGEHCGRYAHLARFFNERGWSARLYDHRGHGRSDGPRGDVPDDQALLRDAKLVLDDFAVGLGEPPLLFGHSMGGLFAAAFAAAALSPLRGLILSSPALGLSLTAPQKMLLASLGAVTPGLQVSNGLQTRYLSHDPEVVRAYENDPLVHPKITPRLLRCMLRTIDDAHNRAPSLAIPVLMLVAGDDRMVDARGSEAFFARLPPGTGTLHRYPAFYHEVFNEKDARRAFGDLAAWMDDRGF
ncbi:alpha/beta hydrolase [Noviherbaspirillum aridicola]|uniref:Hydrolase n=1 Tax=Noviherbaspirillum aridicola TaxID=2849687 RepID=A0ABQ4Q5B3_9BURK|nr:alpha/beta hydrolase [Noviherbaspirillum aridicola]GIZ52192.1 hydrolase [Noviherbaspirillum aridicola]